MRVSILLFSILVSAPAFGQTKFEAFADGRKIGTASFVQKIGVDGSKSVDVRMDLAIGDQKLSLRTQNVYDAKGVPTRKFMDVNIPGGKLQKQVVATFDKNGANIVQIDGGKRVTRQIPLVETAPRENASEFWLVRDKPKVGDSVRTYIFNMDAMAWQLQTVHFRGEKSIKVGNRSVVAYLIETEGERPSKAYLDEKGVPWLIETATTTLKRVGN